MPSGAIQEVKRKEDAAARGNMILIKPFHIIWHRIISLKEEKRNEISPYFGCRLNDEAYFICNTCQLFLVSSGSSAYFLCEIFECLVASII